MTEGITQWTAGGLALRTIARWMVDGGDATKLREFIRWLVPSDVVQTEHLFIVGALKQLTEAGQELSLDRLESTIAAQDPAGFVRMVLQSIVDNRQAGPRPDGPEFDQLVAILRDFRATRNREATEAERNAVSIARSVIARSTGVIEGAKQLAWVERELSPEDRPSVAVFARLTDAVRDYPAGSARKHWASDALARKDAERAQLELDAWPEIERACRQVIDRWAAV
jgi:hypothetical protein